MSDLIRIFYKLVYWSVKLSLIPFRSSEFHITRYYMYRELAKFKDKTLRPSKVLSISHSQQLCEVMGLSSHKIIDANYPDYDILNLSFPENEFDWVICDQVLEHINGNPKVAVSELLRVLKPGGMAVITTCFLNPIHETPIDLWRFSVPGLESLCDNRSQIVSTGEFGNLMLLFLIRTGLRMIKVPLSPFHPIHFFATHHLKEWPVVTWIILRK